jgi:hypothetical protein
VLGLCSSIFKPFEVEAISGRVAPGIEAEDWAMVYETALSPCQRGPPVKQKKVRQESTFCIKWFDKFFTHTHINLFYRWGISGKSILKPAFIIKNLRALF